MRDVLSPALADDDVTLAARLVPTSSPGRGGALNYDRVLRYLRNTLRERANTYVTTFFDLHALHNAFPGYSEGLEQHDPIARATLIEARLHERVVEEAGCRGDRFLAHVQPYEFEGLLFSDVERLVEIEPEWRTFAPQLAAIRSAARSPEHINDGATTHPAERLASTLRNPRYGKVLHGPRAAVRIGLLKISQECAHFSAWLARLRGLQKL